MTNATTPNMATMTHRPGDGVTIRRPSAAERFEAAVQENAEHGRPVDVAAYAKMLTELGQPDDALREAVRNRRIERRRKAAARREKLPELMQRANDLRAEYRAALDKQYDMQQDRVPHTSFELRQQKGIVLDLESAAKSAEKKHSEAKKEVEAAFESTNDPALSQLIDVLGQMAAELRNQNRGKVIWRADRPGQEPSTAAAWSPLALELRQEIAADLDSKAALLRERLKQIEYVTV